MSLVPGLDILELRGRIQAAARWGNNLGSTGDPQRQETYEDLLFPNPGDQHDKAAMADQMSSCVLWARSCLYRSMVDAWELGATYHDHVGQITGWVIGLAKRMNAWQATDTPKALEAAPDASYGDILIIGREGDPAFGGPTHAVVLVEDQGEGFFETSQGGKPEAHGSERGFGILECRNKLERVNGQLWCRSVDVKTGNITPGRRVVGFIDCTFLRRTDE